MEQHDYTPLMIETQVLINKFRENRFQCLNRKILANNGYRNRHERVYHEATMMAIARGNQHEFDECLLDLETLLSK